MVEFALILPMFLLVVIAFIEFAFAFSTLNAINYVARNVALIVAEGGSRSGTDCSALGVLEREFGATSNRAGIVSVEVYFSDQNGRVIGGEVNRYDRNGTLTCTDLDLDSQVVPYTVGSTTYAETSRCSVLAGCGGTTSGPRYRGREDHLPVQLDDSAVGLARLGREPHVDCYPADAHGAGPVISACRSAAAWVGGARPEPGRGSHRHPLPAIADPRRHRVRIHLHQQPDHGIRLSRGGAGRVGVGERRRHPRLRRRPVAERSKRRSEHHRRRRARDGGVWLPAQAESGPGDPDLQGQCFRWGNAGPGQRLALQPGCRAKPSMASRSTSRSCQKAGGPAPGSTPSQPIRSASRSAIDTTSRHPSWRSRGWPSSRCGTGR